MRASVKAAHMTECATAGHAASRDTVISIERVGHVFRTKGRRVQALLETDLRISDGEFLTIVGPSG